MKCLSCDLINFAIQATTCKQYLLFWNNYSSKYLTGSFLRNFSDLAGTDILGMTLLYKGQIKNSYDDIILEK